MITSRPIFNRRHPPPKGESPEITPRRGKTCVIDKKKKGLNERETHPCKQSFARLDGRKIRLARTLFALFDANQIARARMHVCVCTRPPSAVVSVGRITVFSTARTFSPRSRLVVSGRLRRARSLRRQIPGQERVARSLSTVARHARRPCDCAMLHARVTRLEKPHLFSKPSSLSEISRRD